MTEYLFRRPRLKMKTIVATGVFEVIHPGHIMYLTEARKLGDRLVVVVACNETAKKNKRHPVVPAKQRAEVVSALKPVDDVVVGTHADVYKTIEGIRPDVLALGFDQEFDERELVREFSARGLNTKVVRIKARWSGPLNKSKKIIDSFRRK